MASGFVYCLDCRRVVPTKKEDQVNTVPAYCPWCHLRMKYGWSRPEGAYEPTEDDKESFRCAGMAWED